MPASPAPRQTVEPPPGATDPVPRTPPKKTLETKAAWTQVTPAPADRPERWPPIRRKIDSDGDEPARALGEPSATWLYRTADGRPAFLVCRWDIEGGTNGHDRPKTYAPLIWARNGKGEKAWRWQGPATPRMLYNLDRIQTAPADMPVLLVEGEKAADAAAQYLPEGWVASTWPSGAAVVAKPDNDQPGRDVIPHLAAALKRAGHLGGFAAVPVPQALPPKWDLADPLPESTGPANVRALLELTLKKAEPVAESDPPSIEAPAAPAESSREPPGYTMRRNGLFYREYPIDPEKPDIRLTGPFEVVAETRDATGDLWGILLRWRDHDDREHERAIPRRALSGDGSEIRALLLDGGLFVASGRKAREAFNVYLALCRVDARAQAVERVGWHGRCFVLPGPMISDTRGEQVFLQQLGPPVQTFGTSGTLESWQVGIAAPAIGNSRLILALSAAFAAPLLYLAGVESGGVHLRGASSTGKTTALIVAGSVWGGGGIRGYVQTWRATDNGLEAVALGHCDALLCLDELSQVAPKAAGAAAYMLSNGAGKARAGRSGEGRPPAEWRVLFLSSGEISLADKIAEDGRGRRAAAGQQVRVLDLPADAGASLGIFEDLHGAASAGEFARRLKAAAGADFGTAGREFVAQLATLEPDDIRTRVLGYVRDFAEAHAPVGADGQVGRAASRFGLIAAGGELAAQLLILPWPKGAATEAAAKCMWAWLEARGGVEPTEVREGIAQVRAFIEAHGDSRFPPWREEPDATDGRPTINRMGWRRRTADGEIEYLVLPEVWRSEVCQGFDAGALARALAERGLLVRDRTDGKSTSRHRLPGTKTVSRLYHLAPAIMGADDA